MSLDAIITNSARLPTGISMQFNSELGSPATLRFRKRSWIGLTALVGLYYLDFYFDYQELQEFSLWIPWVEYLPFYLLLTLELCKKQLKEHFVNKG